MKFSRGCRPVNRHFALSFGVPRLYNLSMPVQPASKPWLQHYDPGVNEHLAYPDASLAGLFDQIVRKHGARTATKFILRYVAGGKLMVGGSMTYQQLAKRVDRMAASLHAMGLRKGERLAVMLPNSPHFVITFLACMKLGVIVVNTNPTYTSRELKHQLKDSGAVAIVLLNLFYPRLQECIAETAVKHTVVAYVYDTLSFPSNTLVRSKQQKEPDWVAPSARSGLHMFADLVARDAAVPVVDVKPDDVCLFQYTGGTTGLPKAAMLTHRNMVANVTQNAAWINLPNLHNEKYMGAIPFFHVYGMTVCMLGALLYGAELVMVPNPRPIDNVMNIIAKERCTIFPGVPAMYIGIINNKSLAKFDLTSIKSCVSGSAALPVEVQQRFKVVTKGASLVEGYGLTEASPTTHCNPLQSARVEGSVGLPMSDVECRIIDLASGDDVIDPNETPGELLIRGPQVMKGYWNQPEDTANTVDAAGWLHTGDICRMDEKGFFYIVDRKKDMINVGGLKVLPRDVEEVIYTHPKVMEAVVAGIPHPKRGDDTLMAFIVLKQGETASQDEIRDWCQRSLAPHKIPRDIQFRNELPKTQVGKILRRVLVEEEKAKLRG